MHSSTVRSAFEATVGGDQYTAPPLGFIDRLKEQWRASRQPDVLAVVETYPALLQNKSILMDLVLVEYSIRNQESHDFSVSRYCSRFRAWGSWLEQSVCRQLEVQQYFQAHPELLSLDSEQQWPTVGETLCGFHVLDELGSGALARVYLCEEIGLGSRQVVLKLSAGITQEATILGRLQHPHIVPIHSAGVDKQRQLSFHCMPFRGRSTLLDVLDHSFAEGIPRTSAPILDAAVAWVQSDDRDASISPSPLPQVERTDLYVEGVAKLALHVADALAHAHRFRVLHGDIKPTNVLLTPSAEALLVDFNLAQVADIELSAFGGTLPYMPPERLTLVASGRESSPVGAEYDRRSEIFSFGVLLYQLLTGRLPFHVSSNVAEPAAAARQLLQGQLEGYPSVRTGNRQASHSIERLVQRCLSIDAEDRPATIDDVRDHLRQELALWRRTGQRVRLRPVRAGLVATAVATAGVASVIWAATRPPHDERLVSSGLRLQRRGDLISAIDSFNEALTVSPGHDGALFARAQAFMELENWDAATSDFARVAHRDQDALCMEYAGYCLQRRGIPDTAINWYEKALQAGHKTPSLYNNLAVLQLADGSADKAANLANAGRNLARAWELESTNSVVAYNRVMYELAQAQFDPTHQPTVAVEMVQTLLRHDPGNLYYWELAESIYRNLATNDGRWLEDSIAALRQMVVLGRFQSPDELRQNPWRQFYGDHAEFGELLLLLLSATDKQPSQSPRPARLLPPPARDA